MSVLEIKVSHLFFGDTWVPEYISLIYMSKNMSLSLNYLV